VRWLDGEVAEQRCPLCRAPGAKAVRLEVESPFPGRGVLRLLDCGACTSQFFDDQSLPPEYYEDSSAAVKFYVEQGAGIDHMVWPLLRVPAGRVASLAEIGCGFGFALDFARSVLGWRVKGIDRATHALAGTRLLGLDIVPAYFDGPESLGGGSFDLVLASEVLEHVPDPNAFVRGIIEILPPPGIAIFTTPNAVAIHRGQPVGHLLRTLSPGFHLVLFTARSLRAVLEEAGFTQVLIEEEADSLRAYASRAPFELRPLGQWSDHLYRRYLRLRGGDVQLDADLRLGLKYRHFKTLVNAGEWSDAEAEFAELRAMVLDRYGFDLERPETIPAIEPVPLDRALDLVQARSYINQFVSLAPANIVSLLYFRGSLALHTGRPREALEFLRAAGSIGVVARSLQHTLANDGETEDLFKRSFLMSVLALADFAPEAALVELARVLDGDPPPGVPSPLWAFNAEEQEWLLGMTFVRLVDRGFADAAARVFDRLRDRWLAAQGIELLLPGSALEDGTSARDGSMDEGKRVAALRARRHPVDWPRILCARGLLDLNAGDAARALAYFHLAAGLLEADVDPAREPAEGDGARASLYMRIRAHEVLALRATDPEAAVRCARLFLDETCPPDVSPLLWSADSIHRGELLCDVFVGLVNRGDYALAVELAPDVEVVLGAEDAPGRDSPQSMTRTDHAIDAMFCRAMLALNHEGAYRRAAEGFRHAFEEVRERVVAGTASPAVIELLWTARYHEALSRLRAGDADAARSIAEGVVGAPREGLPPAPDSLVAAARSLLAEAERLLVGPDAAKNPDPE
jgi:SAM-dependent methyltransferase